jgi:hypothetical protein
MIRTINTLVMLCSVSLGIVTGLVFSENSLIMGYLGGLIGIAMGQLVALRG